MGCWLRRGSLLPLLLLLRGGVRGVFLRRGAGSSSLSLHRSLTLCSSSLFFCLVPRARQVSELAAQGARLAESTSRFGELKAEAAAARAELQRLDADLLDAKHSLHGAKLAASAEAGQHFLEAERVKLDLEGQAAQVRGGGGRALPLKTRTSCITNSCMKNIKGSFVSLPGNLVHNDEIVVLTLCSLSFSLPVFLARALDCVCARA